MRIYSPVVEAYLRVRWRSKRGDEIADTVQNVMLDCLRDDGPLTGLGTEQCPSFRAYLFGITRIAALREERLERKLPCPTDPELLTKVPSAVDDVTVTRAFDVAFGAALVKLALERMLNSAADAETSLLRQRVLKLRYLEGITPAEIALRTGVEVSRVYKQIESARNDFRGAFLSVVAEQHPLSTQRETIIECEEILRAFMSQ